ncbi:hypothetical protein [Gemmata sp.]|uniref:hypothetical protein n=1 Tax=Gemmata sp. TaxID=1914242 RepID=UPI003F720E37
MPAIARITLALCLLPVVAFCAFGFLATYESPGVTPLRVAYAAIGVSSLTAAGWLVLRGSGPRTPSQPRP